MGLVLTDRAGVHDRGRADHRRNYVELEMTETTEQTLRRQAEQAAYGLGIPFYIRDGRIYATPGGERIDPPTNAHPTPHDTHVKTEEQPK
jgi:hypothetical protein